MLGTAAVQIRSLGPKRGDFDVASPAAARPVDENHAETRANGARAMRPEKLLHLVGTGARRDVIIVGRQSQEQIANAATGPQRRKAGLGKLANYLNREFASRIVGRDLCIIRQSTTPSFENLSRQFDVGIIPIRVLQQKGKKILGRKMKPRLYTPLSRTMIFLPL